MPASFTTRLPDASQPTLGNGVEDEIQLTGLNTLNNGSYDVQYRETDASTWQTTPSVSHTETSTIIQGLEDGEEYEVRVRTSTEHATGTWTTPVAITTKFPGATNPTVAATTSTSATVSGTDNADNEDGFRLIREEQIGGEWADRRVVAERGPHDGEGGFEIVDETASPDTEYRYRIEAYTEHTSAVSSWTSSTTTPRLDGVSQSRAAATGWTIRITHDSGAIHRPRVLSATPQQQLNGKPTLTVEVPRDDKWTRAGFEDATAVVYHDGRRQPVTQLDDVSHNESSTTLSLSGGHELDQKVTTQFDQTPVDDAVRQMLTETTSYEVVVDDYDASTSPDQLQQSSQLQSWRDLIPSAAPLGTDPFYTEFGTPRLLQTAWVGHEPTYYSQEHVLEIDGYYDLEGNPLGYSDPLIGQHAARLKDSSQYAEIKVTPEYDVPADRVGVAYHGDLEGSVSDPPGVVQLNGPDTTQRVEYAAPDGWTINRNPEVGMLTANQTYYLEVYGGGGGGEYLIDGLALFDTKYEPASWPEPDSDGILGELPLFPSEYEIEVVAANPPVSVSGARVDVDASNAPPQALELSNDEGVSWPLESTDSETLSGEFPELGATVQARITLGATDAGGGVITGGDQPQELTSYELYADLDETPLLIDRAPDGRLLDYLQEYAEYADSLFEVSWDTSAGSLRVDWSEPGQRPSSSLKDAVSYDVTKSTRQRVDQIRVHGSGLSGSDTYTGSILDTELALGNENLVSGEETVTNAETDEEYSRGADYSIQYNPGTITFHSSGSIPSDATVDVEYQYKPRGSAWINDSDTPEVRDYTIQGLVTDRGCEIAARRIKRELQEPLWEAEVSISETPGDWSLLGLVNPEMLPSESGGLEVQEESTSGGETTLRLGSREDLSGIIDDVRTRIEQVSQRT